jgi:eukaryotic-like serine/threonine-protein kinase
MLGQRVGKYRVESRLGRGGMGTVYKAVDETLEREVAIKCLNADLGDPDLLKRFRAEAITLARLNHPNIATLFELAEHDGQLLMVMEFVRGETFDRVAQREGSMPVGRAAQLCIQVLDALEHAHRAGIVHRDLKPANLMLTESGLVKVMDFGLARMIGTEHLTNDGYMVGTPAYMSPEQVLGREIDGRADLYAMGVVLFRLLTSQLPFKADSGIAMVQHQLNDPPTPVRQLRSELSVACEELLMRALSKQPSERFPSADDFRSALVRLDPSIAGTGVSRVASSVAPEPSGTREAEPALPPTPVATELAGIPPETLVMPRATGTPLTNGDTTGLASVPSPAPARPAPRAKIAPAAIAAAAVVLAGIPVGGLLVWRSHRSVPPPAVIAAPTPVPAPAPAERSAPAAASTPPSSPSAAAAATPATTPPTPPATRRAAAVKTSAPAPAASAVPESTRPTLPTLTFGKLKLLMIEDNKARDRDAALRLGQDGFEILDGTTAIQTVAYHEVIGMYYSHSKEPRWSTADGRSAAVGKTGSVFGFFKGTPDWITLRTKRLFIPLRVRDDDVHRITTELEARTGSKVVTAK